MLGMSVAQAQREISSSEFGEWMQYIEDHPLPDTKREYESAAICYYITRAFGGNKRGKIEDFKLKYKTRSTGKYPTPDELKTKVQSWLMFEKGRQT